MANSYNPNGKRSRYDDDVDSGWNDGCVEFRPESKLVRVDSSSSIDSNASSGESAVRVNPVDSDEFDIDSAAVDVKMIQEDLLNILEDSEALTDRDPALDSVIKSFEEEIQVPAAPAPALAPLPPVETTSGSGESSPSSQPELGYLLEASDDELGLPPTNNGGVSEERKMEAADFTASPPAVGALDGMLGFENDTIPSYDAFDFGMGSYSESNGGADYVPLGGLFDYSDGGAAAPSEVTWRTETMPAL